MGEFDFDVVIIGASFAGSSFAVNLAKLNDWKILIVEAKQEIGSVVESTGLITEHTRQLFSEFIDIDKYITNKITSIAVVTTDFEDYFVSKQESPWIYQTDTKSLVRALMSEDMGNIAVWNKTTYKSNTVRNADNIISVDLIKDGEPMTIKTRFLIGADGGSSKVAEINSLDRNKKFLFGIEEIYYGEIHLGTAALETIYHFWFGEFSLGYGGWLSATTINGKKAFRIGLAKKLNNATDGKKLLKLFINTLISKGIVTIEGQADFAYGNKIPIGGALKNIYAPGVLLIGDAAGFCGAFAADGIKGAVISAIESAKLVDKYLNYPIANHSLSLDLPKEMNNHHKLIGYYKKQLLYRFIWDRMKSDRTFRQMFMIIKGEKELFLQKFCDSKEKGKSLLSLILKISNFPKLALYAWFLFLDLFKKG